MPGQVQHRLVLHHFAGRHQDAENNAAFASIYDIVGLVPQVCAATFETQWRGIGGGSCCFLRFGSRSSGDACQTGLGDLYIILDS